MEKKILTTFFILGFCMLLYSNLLYGLPLLASGNPLILIILAISIDGLFIICFCWYYFKRFGFSQFILKMKDIPFLLKSCILFILLYILTTPFDYLSIKSFQAEVHVNLFFLAIYLFAILGFILLLGRMNKDKITLLSE